MIFRFADHEYQGATAADIVHQLARDARGFTASGGKGLNEFLKWSLKEFGDRLPPREMDISNRLGDEALARNYLLMRAEYQLGELNDDKAPVS